MSFVDNWPVGMRVRRIAHDCALVAAGTLGSVIAHGKNYCGEPTVVVRWEAVMIPGPLEVDYKNTDDRLERAENDWEDLLELS